MPGAGPWRTGCRSGIRRVRGGTDARPGAPLRRTLSAVEGHLQAGVFGKALGLLAAAEAGPLDERQSARADLLRGQIACASGHASDAALL